MSSSQPSLRDLDRVEDRIRQQRAVDRRPVLLVEGPSDLLVLQQHLPEVQIYPADGRAGVMRATSNLRAWGSQDVVGVIDRDFEQDDVSTAALHPYDGRDLECMLIALGVLELVLQHQGSPSKIQGLGGAGELVQRLKQAVRPVTVLRHHNHHRQWILSFSEIDVGHKFDASDLSFQLREYCSALVAVSETEVQVDDLMAVAEEPEPDSMGPRGKDVVAVAGVALRSLVGSLPVAASREEILTAQLHSSAGLAISQSDWLAQLRGKLSLNKAL